MSIRLDSLSAENAEQAPTIHMMPCRISHDGDANVSKFFTPSIKSDAGIDLKGLTASFRGRPLNGEVLKVPSGYTGVVLQEQRRPFSEDEDRELKVSKKFDNFHYWNLDKICAEDDTFQRALQWLQVSKAIHGPVEDDAQQSLPGK